MTIKIYNIDCRDRSTWSTDALYVIDPPWDNVDLFSVGSDMPNRVVFCDTQRAKDAINYNGAPDQVLIWDCVSSWWVRRRPLKRAKLCLVYGDATRFSNDVVRNESVERPVKLIKTRNPRGVYEKVQHKNPMFSDVYQLQISRMKKSHSHEKPLVWCKMIVGNLFVGVSTIVDLFAGSFVFMDVALQLGLNYEGYEIDSDFFKLGESKMFAATKRLMK